MGGAAFHVAARVILCSTGEACRWSARAIDCAFPPSPPERRRSSALGRGVLEDARETVWIHRVRGLIATVEAPIGVPLRKDASHGLNFADHDPSLLWLCAQ